MPYKKDNSVSRLLLRHKERTSVSNYIAATVGLKERHHLEIKILIKICKSQSWSISLYLTSGCLNTLLLS